MKRQNDVPISLQQLNELNRATLAKLAVEVDKSVDRLRWYPWIIFGAVATGIVAGALVVVKIAGG